MDLNELIFLPRPRNLRSDDGLCPNIEPLVTIDPACGLPAQGYRLRVSPEGPQIQAMDEAGAFYGLATLTQITRQCTDAVPCGTIEDWPDFAVRGVMLDISRDKVPTMATLFTLVDDLAAWKINYLELYTEHTFAYRNHRTVWDKASPMTSEEIRQLDLHCRERFIELVPNQNSFGHFERWFKHAGYRHLSECPDGFEYPWGESSPHGSSLCPGDPGSIRLLDELYTELLPHFTSKKFNVGCDETWELGQGRSKDVCARRGKGRVYLEFLLEIHRLVRSHGRTMHFWGDIILHYPELVKEIPDDVVVLDWGYEADAPFDSHGALLAKSGKHFYVCPGTSTWNSIAGRTENCLGNLRNAAANGLKHGAEGFLNTDWGDNGHWQYLPVSYLGFAAGAALSWCFDGNNGEDFITALNAHVFRDDAGVMGRLAYDLGNAYLKPRTPRVNGSVLFDLLQRTSMDVPAHLQETREYIETVMSSISGARIRRPDADLIKAEFVNAGRMLCLACDRGLGIPMEQLANETGRIVAEHRRIWLERNRPGGLDNSVSRFAAVASAPGRARS